MATLNISIPDTMKEWINQQISAGQYSSASDYLRDLVRSDQRTKQSIDELLLEGLNSGESMVPNSDYWKNKKNNLKAKIGQ